MSFQNWLTFLLTDFVIAITPGPAALLVSMQGFRYGIKPSFLGSLGISGLNLLYYLLSSAGVGALILQTGNLFDYIKAIGSIYLIITGIVMLYSSFKMQRQLLNDEVSNQNKVSFFIQGFVTQATNPKAILFFIVILPQFIDVSKNAAHQYFIFGITAIILETLILILYGWVAARGKNISKNYSFRKWQGRISGLILVGLGIYLFCSKYNTP